MSLYTELLPFIEYIHSIRKLKNYLSFDMVFPSKWSLPKSIVEEGQLVGFDVEDQTMKGVSFVSTIEESEVNKTLSRISKIIKINKEREIKEKLFKQTVEQLKSTFERTDLDKLKNLYFDFDDDTPDLDVNIDNVETNIEENEDREQSTDVELVGEREEKG